MEPGPPQDRISDLYHRALARTPESGHIPREKDQVEKLALDWLDRYLGPVRTR